VINYQGYLDGKSIADPDFPYTMGNRGIIDIKAKQEFNRGAFHHCFSCGCIVPESALNHHHDYHLFVAKKGNTVSTVSWCDPGNHPFKAGAPGSVDYTASVVNAEGRRETLVMDACADHSPFNPPEAKQQKAIEAELLREYPDGGDSPRYP
jgi:hypothetical protein